MPLETGDFISDLVETNPLGSDNVSQGDDHLRLIKHVLKTTFPNLDCAVTATCDELNNAGKSGMPIVTTYTTVASAQTHTFDPASSWCKVIVTGGGGGGLDNGSGNGQGAHAGGTAIKTMAITEATATYTVGGGGAVGVSGTSGADSSFVQGTTTITGQGGPAPYQSPPGTGVGGDINIQGGGGFGTSESKNNGAGGGSYWGTGNSTSQGVATGAYGSGGKGDASGQGGIGASPGMPGIVVIEEY